METNSLIGFALAALLLNLSPGPSLLFVSARGLSEGKAAGVVSALGLATGSSIHAVLAGIGVTAIIATNQYVASVVAISGGVYILYLGLDSLKDARETSLTNLSVKESKKSLRKLYFQAISVEFLNPKTILFYLSVLPGLIISSGYTPIEALFVSLIVPATALPIDIIAGVTSGTLARLSTSNRMLTVCLNYLSGLVLLVIGVGLIYNNL
ncbi:LysE family translocator [Vibrio mediterranei]|uniref:Threonine transporter n=1 Tax=Vibrio mediterranei TaxID=689 RepID=A0AAN1FLN2_9VIBR|nr:LysE family translocator [Vibrio mediterranei]ASI92903.1 threonine transporter [Vibrio mediterranei]